MPTYKNITIKKPGGGTRKQRVQVLKSGKYKFVKNIVKRVTRKTTKRKKHNPKRRIRRMARRRRRRSKKFTIPLAPIAGLASGLAEPIGHIMQGQVPEAMNDLVRNYTGIEPATGKFHMSYIQKGLVPLIAGLMIHKFVGGPPLNANKVLASANVPFIRI